MCGIAGITGFSKEAGQGRVEGMLATLVHRGPDGLGTVVGAGWAIGARRLAVIDLVTGDQPVHNEAASVHAVLNGEIYNYLELRDGLVRRGHRLRSQGDTEVLVHLWEEEGPELVHRLRGMFALAVVDSGTRTLFLARDRLGKKPLYWTRVGTTVAFASELKAIRAASLASPGLDRGALASYLAWGFVPEEQCIAERVAKLPPASWLRVNLDAGEIEQRRYWRLDLTPDETLTFTAAVEDLREGLAEAVRLRLRADVPLAIFLSGGLDSGSVASLVPRGWPLLGLCVAFKGSEGELPLARATAARAGLPLEEIEVDPAEGIELLPKLAEIFDEPLADPSVIPTVLLARAGARRAKVVLNGDGGDEVLGGYRRFLLARAAHGGIARLAMRIGANLGSVVGAGGAAGRAERIAAALRPGAEPYAALGPAKLTAPEIQLLLGSEPIVSPAIASLLEGVSGWDAATRVRVLDLLFFLPGDLLVKMDRATMAASLESRSPFLDQELVERLARLPVRLLARRWHTKAVLRQAAKGWLPDEVRRAPKRGFEPPLEEWLSGPWRRLVRELLFDPTAAVRSCLAGESVAGWADWHRRRDRQRAARALFTLLTLEHWLRRWG